MPWLTVNGVELGGSIQEGSAQETRREIGDTTPAYDGTLRKSRLSVKRDLEFETTPMTSANALAWESYLRGLGERWSFDTSLYGSKGLGPVAGYAATNPAGTPKFGAAILRVTATTGAISYAAALGSNWTAMFWRYETAVWHHYTVLSDGKKWYDGVRNDALSTTWFSVASGTATITNTTGSAVDYDDLVLLPFLVPADWPPVFGVASSAFSNLPSLTLAGDIIPEATTRSALGEVSMVPAKVYLSGSLVTNAKLLSVILSQV